MPRVYVAGPVPRRQDHSDSLAASLYREIQDRLEQAGFDVTLPDDEPWLDNLDASRFFEEISERISSSDYVITVLLPQSHSPAAESVIAAQFEKRQAILGVPGHRLPRMIRGLPYVIAFGDFTEIEGVLEQLILDASAPAPTGARA